MKKALLISLCISIIAGCQKSKEEKITLPESIHKVSIIQFNGWMPDHKFENDTILLDEKYESVMGVMEIDENFDMQIIERQGNHDDYKYGNIPSPNWIRQAIIQTIDSFPSDSIYAPDRPDMYNGHYYFVLIEKKDGQEILLSGRPYSISDEISQLSLFSRDSTMLYVDKKSKTRTL